MTSISGLGISKEQKFFLEIRDFKFNSDIKLRSDNYFLLEGSMNMTGIIENIKISFDFKEFDESNPKPFLKFHEFSISLSGKGWDIIPLKDTNWKLRFALKAFSINSIKNKIIKAVRENIVEKITASIDSILFDVVKTHFPG